MKSFFQNRYVLPDRVITPDEIEGITVDRRTNEVYFNLVDDEVCELESVVYQDCQSDCVVADGSTIFEHDRIGSPNDHETDGTVIFMDGCFYLDFDNEWHGLQVITLGSANNFVKIGMLSWEDRQ